MKTHEPLQPLKELAPLTGLAYKTLLNWHCARKLPFPVYPIAHKPGSKRPDLCAKASDIVAWRESLRVEPERVSVERII